MLVIKSLPEFGLDTLSSTLRSLGYIVANTDELTKLMKIGDGYDVLSELILHHNPSPQIVVTDLDILPWISYHCTATCFVVPTMNCWLKHLFTVDSTLLNRYDGLFDHYYGFTQDAMGGYGEIPNSILSLSESQSLALKLPAILSLVGPANVLEGC